jgi:hypothetical protein
MVQFDAVWTILDNGWTVERTKIMTKISLQTPKSRARLAPRGKPYEIRLLPGVHLGYRASETGTGAWVAIAADGKGGRWTKRFAAADDKQPPDGTAILDYEQAANRARALARGDANAAADRPATIGEALDAYRVDLIARSREPYNADWVVAHLPAHLAGEVLSAATSKQFRDWRDGLIKAGMLPATVNRILKVAKAAFALAGKTDKRIFANAEAWKVGFEALPGATTARDAVLTERQVLATVAAAYEVSPEFGLYCQGHAELGARSSQIARCKVGDLRENALMVPASKKGGKGRKAGHVRVPLMPALAARLRRAASGRGMSAPLFVRPDGGGWQPEASDHRMLFERAARAAGLPEGTTIYSLRHSSIARALLRMAPVRLVASWHDTGVKSIEAHYSRFIVDHGDDLIRSVLLDTTPATPATKVVALRA